MTIIRKINNMAETGQILLLTPNVYARDKKKNIATNKVTISLYFIYNQIKVFVG